MDYFNRQPTPVAKAIAPVIGIGAMCFFPPTIALFPFLLALQLKRTKK